MKSRSLLKSGSGVAPPHPARPAALPGPSFGLGTASAAAESLPLVGLTGPFSQPRPMGRTRKLPHDGTDPEARPSAFWRKVRDSGAGKMELGLLLKSGLPVPSLNRVRHGGSPKRAPSHLRSFRIPS